MVEHSILLFEKVCLLTKTSFIVCCKFRWILRLSAFMTAYVYNLLALDNDFLRVQKTCSCHSSKTAGKHYCGLLYRSTRIVWTGTRYSVLSYNIQPDSLDYPPDNIGYHRILCPGDTMSCDRETKSASTSVTTVAIINLHLGP